MHQIFSDLEMEDGTIFKKEGDYSTRKGQTTKPIATNTIRSVQVLHAILRCFDHFMKVAVHAIAGILAWTESKTSIYYQFLVKTKLQLQDKIEDLTGNRWDRPNGLGQGGTTTTGNTAKKLLYDTECREMICSTIAQDSLQSSVREYGSMLSIILQAMNSDRSIDVENYKGLCTSLYIFLLKNFPWVSITPSLHKVLAHSWEVIEANEGKGLKRLDESGLEANNKILRHLRTKLSRKCDEDSNLTDVIQRMWFCSDPIIDNERSKGRPFCKTCNERGHSTRYCSKKYVLQTAMSEEQNRLEALYK